ncbi:hypothetical protein KDK95_09850 [Actinospica sp. MGRD01-02]|uniref:Uncharacterized protein n=1 Tax=Actinospica acidithermotolerans TaxID=2828514 RepID=A0A941E8Q4_9ACTN|nr:hypothetical protein [Actinospica acidithermotolerans]MBR7826607.1 hypothetical protein [Actinospica acidithermotolerans]
MAIQDTLPSDPIRVRRRDPHSLVEVRAVGGVDAGRIWSLGMGTHTLGPAPDSAVHLRGAHAGRPGVRLTVTAGGEAWLAIPDPRPENSALPPEPGVPTLRTLRPMEPAGTPWAFPQDAASAAQELRWPEGAQLSIYGTRLSVARIRPVRSADRAPASDLERVERDALFERAVRCAEVPDPAALAADVTGRRATVGWRKPGMDGFLRLRLGSADGGSRTERWILPGLPCAVDLADAGILGVASVNLEAARALARWLVVQAATHCAPDDLGIRILADPSAGRSWEWAAKLPHGSRQGEAPAATDPRSVGRNIAELAAELAARAELPPSEDRPSRALLAVIDRASMLREVDGVAQILGRGPEFGIYAICVDTIAAIVPECRVVGRTTADELALSVRRQPERDRGGITPDLVGTEWCTRVAGTLASAGSTG